MKCKYYQNKLKFNGAYSRKDLPKINNEAYVTNIDEYESIETQWIALYVNGKNIIYLHSFAVEHISKQIKNL